MKTYLIGLLNSWFPSTLSTPRPCLIKPVILLTRRSRLRPDCLRARLEEVTPQLRADGDDYRLRMARKEVNDEIDHIYVTGARMRGEPLG